MVIAGRLKALREEKKLSQGDIEKRTGLLRCYISRVENGHTVPSIATLERIAAALQVPMYRLFTDEDRPARPAVSLSRSERTPNKKQDAMLRPFSKALSRMNDRDRSLIVYLASKMAAGD